MANIVIGHSDRITAATLSASTSDPSLPVSRVATPSPRETWRSTTGGPTWLLADLGASYTTGAILLGGCNFIPAVTLRLRISTSDPTGEAGDAYDVAVSGPAAPFFVHILPTPRAGRYRRLDMSGATAGYHEIGRWWDLATLVPRVNLAMGAEEVGIDLDKTVRSRGGQTYGERNGFVPGLQITLPGLTTHEKDALGAAVRRAGLVDDVMLCRDPGAAYLPAVTVIGPRSGYESLRQAAFDRWTTRLTVYQRA